MTASTPVLQEWARRPSGIVARAGLAVAGMGLATLVLTYAALAETGSWALVLLGVSLAALAVRAAHHPTLSRIGVLAAGVVAIPLSLQVF